ncbi:MAG TPA: hypothetical protein EYN60_06745 [Nitrospirales bacterium]|nr:hypothetical protein [Nitrospirales bacterium]
MKLQDYGFKNSQYERPTQNWVCGWAAEGWACHIGPDKNGQCLATTECLPLKDGDRWSCTRSSDRKGKCTQGPLPNGTCSVHIPKCQPSRSLRAKRGIATVWTVAFTIGASLLVLFGSDAQEFFSPGELSTNHAAIGKDCASCHAAAHEGPISWVAAIDASESKAKGSKLCLSCHQVGEQPLQAHGRSTEALTSITERLKEAPFSEKTPVLLASSDWLPGTLYTEGSEVPCARCHSEHHGRDFKLMTMDNQRCQTCHIIKFSSLTKGHPQFSSYPTERRTQIAFDHNSHLAKHFLGDFKDEAPTTCTACHMMDQLGETMRVGSFDATCAACHVHQIEGEGLAGARGIPFFRLPGLDVDVLTEQGISVGEWPADYNVEQGLTPFMKLLLYTDGTIVDYLETVGDFDEFTDLSDATEEELAAIAQIIWAIKGLFYDMVSKGQEAYVSRLSKIANEPYSNSKLGNLTGHIPIEVIQAAQQEWLPKLSTEVLSHRAHAMVPMSDMQELDLNMGKDQDRERWVKMGGWYRQDADFSILFRPTGHADEFIRGWIDLSPLAEQPATSDVVNEIFSTLSGAKAPGVCMKCHSVDSRAEKAQVKWHTAQPVPNVQKFTTFVHSPHLSLVRDRGCYACHVLNSEADVMAGYEDNDPQTFASSFNHIEKSLCVTCHVAEKAGDMCISCHNYHVGNIAERHPNALLAFPKALEKKDAKVLRDSKDGI